MISTCHINSKETKMSERDVVKKKIAKLMNLGTSSNMAEASLALSRATTLMEKWGLELSDIELQDQRIIRDKIQTGRKQKHPLHHILVSLAKFCSVKVWFQASHRYIRGSQYEVHMIGYEEDIETFKYFWAYLERLLETELETFRNSDEYVNRYMHGKSLRASFLLGFTDTLNSILFKKAEEKSMFKTRSGTALVPLKMASIEAWFEENTNMKLRATSDNRRIITSRGYNSGMNAANNVSFNTPVNNESGETKLLT